MNWLQNKIITYLLLCNKTCKLISAIAWHMHTHTKRTQSSNIFFSLRTSLITYTEIIVFVLPSQIMASESIMNYNEHICFDKQINSCTIQFLLLSIMGLSVIPTNN